MTRLNSDQFVKFTHSQYTSGHLNSLKTYCYYEEDHHRTFLTLEFASTHKTKDNEIYAHLYCIERKH